MPTGTIAAPDMAANLTIPGGGAAGGRGAEGGHAAARGRGDGGGGARGGAHIALPRSDAKSVSGAVSSALAHS